MIMKFEEKIFPPTKNNKDFGQAAKKFNLLH